jgi:hypothetical protein
MRRLLAGNKRLLAGNNWNGMAKAFHNLTVFGQRSEASALSAAGELPFILEMPDGCEGKTVPTGTVMMALLWQYYGLDLPHPEVSRWLEQNAPDVKYAVARNRSTSSDEDESADLKVSSDGTIKVHLSPEVDQRLREVSSQYIVWQTQAAIELQEEQSEDFTPSPFDVTLCS